MKNKSTNLILVISIIFLMIFSFTFVYLLNVIKNKNNHISAVSITLGKKMAEKENLTVLEKKMTELVETQKKISNYFVDTLNIDKFVEYLESIGADNGVEVSVNSIDMIKNDKTKMSVNLSIKGNFVKTTKTIGILENSPYNIIINSLYFNKEIITSNTIDPVDSKTTDKKKETSSTKDSLWQADINFIVLNL